MADYHASLSEEVGFPKEEANAYQLKANFSSLIQKKCELLPKDRVVSLLVTSDRVVSFVVTKHRVVSHLVTNDRVPYYMKFWRHFNLAILAIFQKIAKLKCTKIKCR